MTIAGAAGFAPLPIPLAVWAMARAAVPLVPHFALIALRAYALVTWQLDSVPCVTIPQFESEQVVGVETKSKCVL
jgi:hypothetical protein